MNPQIRLKVKAIVEWIFSNYNSTNVEVLDDLIERALIDILPYANDYDRLDEVTKISPLIRNSIDQYISDCRERGVFPLVQWSQLDNRKLIGRTFLPTNANCDIIKEKEKFVLIENMIKLYLKLDPMNEFELLCCIIMESDGINEIKRTIPPDKRIDFFGIYPGSGEPGSTYDFTRKIIGQAKRYGIRVGEPKVDTLCSAINNLEKRKPRMRNVLPGEFIDLELPCGGYFIVSGEFTGIAWSLIKTPEEKLIGRDGYFISNYLIENNIGFIEDQEKKIFDINILKEYLEKRREDFPIYSNKE